MGAGCGWRGEVAGAAVGVDVGEDEDGGARKRLVMEVGGATEGEAVTGRG